MHPTGRPGRHLRTWATTAALAVVALVAPSAAQAATGGSADISGASWSEPEWCAERAPLGDLSASYGRANLKSTLIEIAKRRYPPAVGVFEPFSQAAIAKYLEGGLPPEEQDGIFGWLFGGLVHEMGHEWDSVHRSRGYTYRFFDDRVYRTAAVTTFPRSEILKRYPNQSGNMLKRYLRGTGGSQGINSLLEEFVQYVHQLAAARCIMDIPPEVAEIEDVPGELTALDDRDFVATFMWYMEAYLKIAREDHPADYRKILKARGLRTAIIDTWRRADYLLARTQSPPPGSFGALMEQRVRDPENLREIEMLANG